MVIPLHGERRVKVRRIRWYARVYLERCGRRLDDRLDAFFAQKNFTLRKKRVISKLNERLCQDK